MMRKVYHTLKVCCYTGLGIVLHLAKVELDSGHFWAVIFLALAIDLSSGWLQIEKFRNALEKDTDGSSKPSGGS